MCSWNVKCYSLADLEVGCVLRERFQKIELRPSENRSTEQFIYQWGYLENLAEKSRSEALQYEGGRKDKRTVDEKMQIDLGDASGDVRTTDDEVGEGITATSQKLKSVERLEDGWTGEAAEGSTAKRGDNLGKATLHLAKEEKVAG
ncbi:MAG: hypothetical protein M1827_006211 [Pycnora praestabilis]|nr:MAG: hypothetical protein M1827_006211 [Pycnora praestabilis]